MTYSFTAKGLQVGVSRKEDPLMKRIFLLVVALLLSAVTASATATAQKWTAGWDNFGEPLNYTRSKISWSVNATTHKLSVTLLW